MRKIYSLLVIVFLFLLAFAATFESSEIDDHCYACEEDYENDLDSGVYYIRMSQGNRYSIKTIVIEN